MIFDNAGSVSGTALAFARIDALVVDARLVRRAAPVLETDGHAGLALLVAHADGFVLKNLAGLAFRTRSGLARVLTSIVDAGEMHRAL